MSCFNKSGHLKAIDQNIPIIFLTLFFSHLQDLESQLAESHDRVRQLELELEQLRSGKDQDEAETDAGSRGFVILK